MTDQFDFTDIIEKPSAHSDKNSFDFSDVEEKTPGEDPNTELPTVDIDPSTFDKTGSNRPLGDVLKKRIVEDFIDNKIYESPKTREAYYTGLAKKGYDYTQAKALGEKLIADKKEAIAGIDSRAPKQEEGAISKIIQAPAKNLVEGVKSGVKEMGMAAANQYTSPITSKLQMVEGMAKAAFGVLNVVPAVSAFSIGMETAHQDLEAVTNKATAEQYMGYALSPLSSLQQHFLPNASEGVQATAGLLDIGAQLLLIHGATKLAGKLKAQAPMTEPEVNEVAQKLGESTPQDVQQAARKVAVETAHPDVAPLVDQKLQLESDMNNLVPVMGDAAKNLFEPKIEQVSKEIESKNNKIEEDDHSQLVQDSENAHLQERKEQLEQAIPLTNTEEGKMLLQTELDKLKKPTENASEIKSTEPVGEQSSGEESTRDQGGEGVEQSDKGQETTGESAPEKIIEPPTAEAVSNEAETNTSDNGKGQEKSESEVESEKQNVLTQPEPAGEPEQPSESLIEPAVSSEKTAAEKKGISDANTKAKKHGFDSATHLINSAKKYLGEEYKAVQEIPAKKLAELKRARKAAKKSPPVIERPSLSEIKSDVIEKAPEAKASAKKEGVSLKIQKDDLLNQINRARLLVKENLPDDMIEETLKKEGFETSIGKQDRGKSSEKDVLQVVFDVEGDGQFKLNARLLDQAYKDVEKHWKINEGPASGSTRLGGKKLESGVHNVPDAKTYAEAKKVYDDATESLKSAQKGADDKVIKFFAEAQNYAKKQMETLAEKEKVTPEYQKPTTYESAIPTSDKHYINVGGIRFEKVKGKDIPNELGADIFVHETKDAARPFVVSEGRSGLEIVSGETEADAVKKALDLLNDRGADLLNSKVKENEQKYGTSPRYATDEAKQDANAKIAKGLDGIANKLGAKKNLLPEERTKLIDDLKNIVQGVVERTGIAIEDAIAHVKEWLDKNYGELPEEERKSIIDELTNKKEEPRISSEKNEMIEKRAEELGFSEELTNATKSASRDFGKVWDEAAADIESKKIDPATFRKNLADNPVPKDINLDTANAILLHDQIALENSLDKVIDQINKGDLGEAELRDLQNRKANIQNDLYDNFVASKKLGTQLGRGLNARKMLADKNFSISNMQNEFRAEQGGKPLTPEQEKFIEERYKEIREKSKAWDDFQANKEEYMRKLREDVGKEVEKKYSGQKQTISQKSKKLADKVRQLKTKPFTFKDSSGNVITVQEMGFYNDAIEIIAKAIELGGALAESIQKGVEHLKEQDFYKALSKQDQAAIEKSFADHFSSNEMARQEKNLRTLKTRYKKATEKYQKDLEEGNFEREKRKTTTLDEEAQKLKAELQKAKDDWYVGKEKLRLEQRGWKEKGVDKFLKYVREGLLSGIPTLGKLASFGIFRQAVMRPLYNLSGEALRLIPAVNRLSGKAISEGRMNFSALAENYKTFVRKETYQEALKKFNETGKSDIDRAYGEDKPAIGELPLLATKSHGAIKHVPLQAEMNYVRKAGKDWMERNGKSDDPLLNDMLPHYAYAKGMDAIYMGESKTLKQYQLNLRMWEQQGGAKYALAKAARFFFPIIKVPYNFFKDAGIKHTPVQLAKSMRDAFAKDVEKLTPEEADLIMLNMKKGLVGTGMMLLGGYLAQKTFGGNYTKDENKHNNILKAGDLQFGDTKIPHWATHNSLVEAAQIGATMSNILHDAPEEYGTFESFARASTMAFISEANKVPFYGETARAMEQSRTWKGVKDLGADQASKLIPLFVQNVAQALDTRQGEVEFHPFEHAREVHPKTVKETFESKLPVLRNIVPTDMDRKVIKMLSPGKPESIQTQLNKAKQQAEDDKELMKALIHPSPYVKEYLKEQRKPVKK